MCKYLFSIILLSIVLGSCNSPSRKKTSLSHDQKMATATRSEKDGWIIVHLQGSPDVIGYQHGYLLANEIVDLRGAMGMLNLKTTGKSWEFYRNESARLFWKNTDEEYQKEIDG